MSRDSSVGVVTTLRAGRPRVFVSIPERAKEFSPLQIIKTDSEAPPNFLFNGLYMGRFLRL